MELVAAGKRSQGSHGHLLWFGCGCQRDVAMKLVHFSFFCWGILLLTASTSSGQTPALMGAVSQELDRNFAVLKQNADPAPYFISYEITEQEYRSISGTRGVVTPVAAGKIRTLDVSVRVGSPQLDNYHPVSGRGGSAQFTSGAAIPFEDAIDSIKRRLWLETDRSYRAAAERLIQIETNKQVRVEGTDDSADFSREETSVFQQTPPNVKFDEASWRERVRKLSARFQNFPSVLTSQVIVSCQTDTRYFVSTEGSRIQSGRGYARVILQATAKATDGEDLETSETFEAVECSGLPKDETIQTAIDRLANNLTALLSAPVAEPFVGPAIFSGRAAGVFFHEIFGHRIEGHRQKDESEGQTFTRSVGTSVLPDFLSVVFDPARRKIGDVHLNGWYDYDDEGVKAQPVTVVDKGVLKTFLMSRSPVKGFDRSNGHGRRQPGYEVVSRQSNLVVESSKTVSETRLRQMLLEEVKRQNKPYGLFFAEVTGGYTTTARAGLQAFKVIPVVVYRVYADGRPDEMVRGADIVGTPLASFAKIMMTSDRPEVFNGYCGAESGSVPVSAVSPEILVSEIEIEKKAKASDRPPLLPAPPSTINTGGLQ
jgi:TldD protein